MTFLSPSFSHTTTTPPPPPPTSSFISLSHIYEIHSKFQCRRNIYEIQDRQEEYYKHPFHPYSLGGYYQDKYRFFKLPYHFFLMVTSESMKHFYVPTNPRTPDEFLGTLQRQEDKLDAYFGR